MEDMTDKAIAWIGQQQALIPDKPFFVYFAPGATHAPHHVPKEWADKYKGKFDAGWDKTREDTFARQKKLGVIPQDAQLTKRHAQIPAFDDMPEALKPVLRRQMEVYAGFLEYTDYHVGRLFDNLERIGVMDNTLIYYIVGDNGASAEGTLNGTFNEMINFNGAAALETPEFLMERIDKLGDPTSYNHYAVGWAHAMNTPYQWTKQVASHWGGTRNGTTGAAVGGAARGAIGGAAIGAIAGDAGTGAAIGAAAGAMGGRRAKKQAEAQAGQKGAQQAQAQNQAAVDQFKKAAGVCLEGRGHSVK